MILEIITLKIRICFFAPVESAIIPHKGEKTKTAVQYIDGKIAIKKSETTSINNNCKANATIPTPV